MKKLLLALLLILGTIGLAPKAEAGGYGRDRYVRYYDHCDRPVYGYTYRERYHYRRPVVYHRVRHSYYDDYYCAPRVRYYSRPRVSFHIGF